MIRIVLAEDQAMVLGALAALLELERDLEVVGRAPNGEVAVALCRELRPDVLITDIEMPLLSGIDVARVLRDEKLPTKVVIVTTFARSGYLRRAFEAGAAGYLLKDAPAERLAADVRRVAAGGRVIDPTLAAEAWGDADPLTERERQVLRLAADGHSSPTIASRLNLSDGTVRNYLSEAITKLGASNRIEAARLARDKGWI